MKNLFGFLEHIAFYLIIIFLIIFIISKSETFIYSAILSWFVSMASHIIESKLEGKSIRKIIGG